MAHRHGYKAVSSLPADSQSHAQQVHIELRFSTAALALFVLTVWRYCRCIEQPSSLVHFTGLTMNPPALPLSAALSISPSLYQASLSCIWQGFSCCISFLYCPFRPSWLRKSMPLFPICACARLLCGVCSDVGCHVAWVSMVWRVLLGPAHSWDQCFTNLLQVVFGDPSHSHYVPLLRVCLPDWRNSSLVHAALL